MGESRGTDFSAIKLHRETTGEVGFEKKVKSLILTVSSLGTLVKYN